MQDVFARAAGLTAEVTAACNVLLQDVRFLKRESQDCKKNVKKSIDDYKEALQQIDQARVSQQCIHKEVLETESHVAQQLEQTRLQLEQKRKTLRDDQEALSDLRKRVEEIEQLASTTHEKLIQERYRTQLFLGFTFGKTDLGTEYTFTTIDPRQLARKFQFCIRQSYEHLCISRCSPEVKGWEQVSQQLEDGGLRPIDAICAMRKLFCMHVQGELGGAAGKL